MTAIDARTLLPCPASSAREKVAFASTKVG